MIVPWHAVRMPPTGYDRGAEQEALKRGAERCEMVLFLGSPAWASSKWCRAEFLLAKSLNKRIFTVIVEPTPCRRCGSR